MATPQTAALLNALETARGELAALPTPARGSEVDRLARLAAVQRIMDRMVLDPEICAAVWRVHQGEPDEVPAKRLETLASEVAKLGGQDAERDLVLLAELGEVDAQGKRGLREQTTRIRRERLARLGRLQREAEKFQRSA